MTTLQIAIRQVFAPIALMLGTLFVLWMFTSLTLEPSTADAAAVTVTANVAQTVSCTASASSTAFGTLVAGSVDTASPNTAITVSCNPAGGCTLNVSDANSGLTNASSTHTILSADADLSSVSEGYGIQASAGSMTVDSKYTVTGTTVGALTTGGLPLATIASPVSNDTVTVTHKAVVSATTPSGSYSDTITYSCLAN